MGKDLFNEKKSRFSLRKLNIGVCSVLLGTLIMIGGTAQADENTETTAAPVSPVVEAGETTASLVETRTVAETTPAATNPVASATASTSVTAPAAVETQQLRRALHHKLHRHRKHQQVQRLPLLLKLHKHQLQRLFKQLILLKQKNHAFVHVVRFLLQRLHLQQKHLLRTYQLRLKLVMNMLLFVQMQLQLLR